MSRAIQKGDIVDVYYSEGTKLDPDFSLYGVKVLSTPQDVGDLWYVEDDKYIHAFNPMSSLFISIAKKKGSVDDKAQE